MFLAFFLGVIAPLEIFMMAGLVFLFLNEEKLIKIENAAIVSFYEKVFVPIRKNFRRFFRNLHKNRKNARVRFARKLLKNTGRIVIKKSAWEKAHRKGA